MKGNKIELYHGSEQIIKFPGIKKTRYTKDFSWGFYCVNNYGKMCQWVKNKYEKSVVNVYSYIENPQLNIKKFDKISYEWLEFVLRCRSGKIHGYDIVEGPIMDNDIWSFITDHLGGYVDKEIFEKYVKFKHPTYQISFHSIRALECLKYERSEMIDDIEEKFVFFHKPEEKNGYLSNWYPVHFKIMGTEFSSMEQYMMFQKAKYFKDVEVANKILNTSDVAKIKELGREVKGYKESFWNGVRQIVVYEGLVAKFSQNIDLKEKLIKTGNAILAECAVKDRIWGIGLSMKDEKRFECREWRGQNLLGYALMMVREKLSQ